VRAIVPRPEAAGAASGPDPEAIVGCARTLGLALDPAQGERLAAFGALLQRWGRTYNLTAIRDREQLLTHHLADCLAAVGPLRRHLVARAAPSSLLDVGSGGGLPGVVFAIACPELAVCCVDAVGKKVAFVRQAAAELGLPNLRGEHARVEAMEGRFDVVASRAFASLADFVALTRARLADGGVWLAMKGQRPDPEIAALPADVEVFHVEPLAVPGLDASRCLVWMRPA
jgi:16S rRNA (guanine527-N7)-methyltransferase